MLPRGFIVHGRFSAESASAASASVDSESVDSESVDPAPEEVASVARQRAKPSESGRESAPSDVSPAGEASSSPASPDLFASRFVVRRLPPREPLRRRLAAGTPAPGEGVDASAPELSSSADVGVPSWRCMPAPPAFKSVITQIPSHLARPEACGFPGGRDASTVGPYRAPRVLIFDVTFLRGEVVAQHLREPGIYRSEGPHPRDDSRPWRGDSRSLLPRSLCPKIALSQGRSVPGSLCPTVTRAQAGAGGRLISAPCSAGR